MQSRRHSITSFLHAQHSNTTTQAHETTHSSTMASAKQQIDGYSYAPVAVPVYGDGDEDPLADSFFGADVASFSAETVSPDARPYLEVVAPSTLPEVSILHISRERYMRNHYIRADFCE